MVLKGYLFLLPLCLCAIGCDDGDISIPYDEAKFVRAIPSSGEIPVNGTITVIFDNPPRDIEVSTSSVTVAGKRVTIVRTVIYDKAPADVRDKAPADVRDKAPADVRVSAGPVIVSGKRVTIGGPFIPGSLGLTITWADGTQQLIYRVTS